MSTAAWLQLAVFMALLLALAWPLARYIDTVMSGRFGVISLSVQKTRLSAKG